MSEYKIVIWLERRSIKRSVITLAILLGMSSSALNFYNGNYWYAAFWSFYGLIFLLFLITTEISDKKRQEWSETIKDTIFDEKQQRHE